MLDVNECSENSHACSQMCINDLGTYHCDCFNGFQSIITTPTDVTCTGKYTAPLYACYLSNNNSCN